MILDGVKAWFSKWIVFILLGVIVGMAAYGGIVIYGLKKQVEAQTNTINSQTTTIATLSAEKAVVKRANERFKEQLADQEAKIKVMIDEGLSIDKANKAEIAAAKRDIQKWKAAYESIWGGKQGKDESSCAFFFSRLKVYIDTRQQENAK